MNIENFKEEVSEKKELTPEEKEQVRNFYIQKGAKDYKACISEISCYLSRRHLTIEQAIEEVNSKTSLLSKSRREFLVAINPDVWKEWLKPKNKVEKFTYEADKS